MQERGELPPADAKIVAMKQVMEEVAKRALRNAPACKTCTETWEMLDRSLRFPSLKSRRRAPAKASPGEEGAK